ncbi:MAG: AMP-binding protein [Moraxellaceae bacterium]|nr:AMP-binding protein [Pseudobdellovibrionaceae bacterium]
MSNAANSSLAQKLWTRFYPKQVPAEINLAEYENILELLKESVRKFGEKTAFTNFDCAMSYQELDAQSDLFASYLQHTLNLKKGDRIAIQLPNIMQFPVIIFASLKAGLTIVNTNPLYTAKEMKHQFNDSGATTIVILAQFAHLLESILPETPIKNVVVTQVGDALPFIKKNLINFVLRKVKKMVPDYNLKHHTWAETLKLGSEKKYTQPQILSSDIAFLQYTGGTTGVSKGAILTHRNIVANALQICAWMRPKLIEGEEIAIAPLPLYHIFSLTVCCLAFMKYGANNVLITNPRDIPAFIKTMKKYKFTIVTGVNTLYNALTNHPDFKTVDFSSLKISVAGAMALQTSVQEKWKSITGTRVIEGYGLTETSPVACVNPVDGTDRPGSIGLPVSNTDVKLIDEDGKDITMSGERGEICIKGPQVMQGYYNQPAETAKSIIDGWFSTGDIGTMDKDGFFKIVDRKKDMILVSGFNVYPNEVEDVIALHPKVKEVAAIGVADEHSGEVVKVCIVKADESLTEKEVIEFARLSLTNYKVPKKVVFMQDLPKTNVGKILRRALRDQNPS